jgi:peptidoglycan/LPS O-acetylase OafA/YrhL
VPTAIAGGRIGRPALMTSATDELLVLFVQHALQATLHVVTNKRLERHSRYMTRHNTDLTHPKYRPDIDGLRAIAVLTVVGFHAFPGWIRGGFIGVDVFFVISGFLISLIIFSNLEHDRFSLADFYGRRIKRVFPALLLVMVTCFVFGWFVLFADEFMQLGKHLAGGASFVSNFVLYEESGYFDSAAETKPLLHLWSLAIEEQFYILWPLLLAFMWKRKLSFVTITVTVAAISFAANIYAINNNPTAAFFLPLPRFWELMAGGLLAYVALHKPQINNHHQNAQSTLGVVFLTLGLLLLNKASAFPGWWAILPVMGAFFIISAGPNAWFNQHVLSNRLLVWVGLISYPLYLWHWPLLTFARIMTVHPSPALRLTAVSLSVLLAWLTFILVERRIRWSKHSQTAPRLTIALFLVLLIGYFSFSDYGFRNREVNKPFVLTDQKLFMQSRSSDNSCAEKLKLKLVTEEVCLTNTNTPQILFAGDSHAMALYSAIYAKKFTTPSILIAGHACPVYPNLEYTPRRKVAWGNNCTAIAQEVLNVAQKTSSIKTIILSSIHTRVTTNKQSNFRLNGHTLNQEDAFLAGSGYLIDQLLRLGKEVIYVVDVPRLKFDPKECESRGGFSSPKQCTYSRLEFDKSRSAYRKALQKLRVNHPRLQIFDTTELFCDQQNCRSKDANGALLYADLDHLSVNGSEIAINALLDKH